MIGIGKSRSKFGKWLDKNRILQEEIRKRTKLGSGTITSLCNDMDYIPRISTWVKVERALKSMGYRVGRYNFFDI